MDEANHPESITKGNLVVTEYDDDPVVARVLDVVDRPGGDKVIMELVGDASELLKALVRARVFAA
jgi:hypothetical protein